ncbi:MAG: hypothetical protein ABJG88_10880 [Litorimonas sp.]
MRVAFRYIFTAVCLSMLLACTPVNGGTSAPSLEASVPPTPPVTPTVSKPQTIDDIDFTQYSRELASHTDLKEGQSRIRAIDVVRLLFAPEEGANIIKTTSSTFELDGGALMLLSADGMADDSVRAQEFYLIFEGDKGAQKLADYGLRVKCWRGSNIKNWQKERCS